ncbi:hypothetical protein TNCV_4261521 [Trichonephila clavipes]|nr:hypothetical protein TNCV_4261521 [Trichonephila clavipes]
MRTPLGEEVGSEKEERSHYWNLSKECPVFIRTDKGLAVVVSGKDECRLARGCEWGGWNVKRNVRNYLSEEMKGRGCDGSLLFPCGVADVMGHLWEMRVGERDLLGDFGGWGLLEGKASVIKLLDVFVERFSFSFMTSNSMSDYVSLGIELAIEMNE